MTPARDRILIGSGVVLALLCGLGVANGEWLWPTLAGAVAVAVGVARLSPRPVVPTLLLGLMAGYLVGNRGFAQLSLSGRLPFFPAEVILGVCGLVWIWDCARTRGVDERLSGPNLAVLLWLVYGTLRLFPEIGTYGIASLRDYAMVYYAGFFFLAQKAVRECPFTDLFARVLRWGTAAMLPLYWLFTAFPEIFLDRLTFRGAPILFFKTDIAGTFLAAGALAWFIRPGKIAARAWGWAITAGCIATIFSTHNRASMLALIVGGALVALRTRAGVVRAALVAAALSAVGTVIWVEAGRHRWEDTPFPAAIEALVSVGDIHGRGRYTAEEVENKGDNNRFRTVWWRTVIAETTDKAPLLGLGYGYDLAAPFLRVYYPDSTDDFTARSPHSIFVTCFARLGAVGLAVWMTVACLASTLAWRSLRAEHFRTTGVAGLTVIVLLVSACFGVVLEGPMGAAVFWIAFGVLSEPPATENQREVASGD